MTVQYELGTGPAQHAAQRPHVAQAASRRGRARIRRVVDQHDAAEIRGRELGQHAFDALELPRPHDTGREEWRGGNRGADTDNGEGLANPDAGKPDPGETGFGISGKQRAAGAVRDEVVRP